MVWRWTLAVTLLAVALCPGCGGSASEDAPTPTGMVRAKSASRGPLSWEKSWDGAFRRARSEDRVVMVMFYADWCVWCKRMDSATFTDPEVVGLLSPRVVPLRLDGEREGRVLTGKLRVDGYPTIVFLAADEHELGRVPGFLSGPDFVHAVRGWLG